MMASQQRPAPDPDRELIEHLSVRVEPAHRPGRWAWQLVDARDGSVFETGFDYDSPAAARRSGLARLAQLGPSPPDANAVGSRHAAHDHLVIVSRPEEAIYTALNRILAGTQGVEVIRDRRHPALTTERRQRERRSRQMQAVAQARALWIICSPDPAHRETA